MESQSCSCIQRTATVFWLNWRKHSFVQHARQSDYLDFQQVFILHKCLNCKCKAPTDEVVHFRRGKMKTKRYVETTDSTNLRRVQPNFCKIISSGHPPSVFGWSLVMWLAASLFFAAFVKGAKKLEVQAMRPLLPPLDATPCQPSTKLGPKSNSPKDMPPPPWNVPHTPTNMPPPWNVPPPTECPPHSA